MAKKLTRRDFIKKSSLSAAGVSVLSSFNPLFSALAPAPAKSRVVIAKDTSSYSGSSGNQASIQVMVDQAIMSLTGITDKVKAYESLFPNLTTSTKIVIKYNSAKPATTRALVSTALTNSLKLMINGTFPSTGVTLVGTESSPVASTQSFKVASYTCTINNTWVNCDYFINLPPCYAMPGGGGMGTTVGAAMSLKNMINTFSGSSISTAMHPYFTNATTPSLSIVNSQPIFKQKQVLTLMDAVIISTNGTATTAGYSIIASKDMVAVDYQGLQLLKAAGYTGTDLTNALTVLGLAAVAPYSIGTNVEANMEVLNITPPYTSEIISSGSPLSSIPEIQAKTESGRTVFEYAYGQRRNAVLAIYDMKGRQVWSSKVIGTSIVWKHNDLNGNNVTSGAYLYMLKIGDIIARGTIAIRW